MTSRSRGHCPRHPEKVRYADEIGAKLALSVVQHPSRQDREKTPQRTYYCPACSGYHLTSQPEKK